MCVCMNVCVRHAGCRDERGRKKTPTVLHCHSDMETSREGRDERMEGQRMRLIHRLDKRYSEDRGKNSRESSQY